jgi:hypothetical protein
VFFFTYLRRELRRRMRQAVVTALGLALGIGPVITVTALSSGVRSRLGVPRRAFLCRSRRLAGGGLGQAADGSVDRGRDDVAVAQDQAVGR